jgi:hypothetical protein
MPTFYDRVADVTTTTGTGTLTLAGTPPTGYQSFAVVGNGNQTYYCITDTAGDWEVGIGTYSSSGHTLSRTTVYESSNSNSLVSFPSGTKQVFQPDPATFLNSLPTGSGTQYDLAVWSGSETLTTSQITDNGSNITVPASGTLTISGNGGVSIDVGVPGSGLNNLNIGTNDTAAITIGTQSACASNTQVGNLNIYATNAAATANGEAGSISIIAGSAASAYGAGSNGGNITVTAGAAGGGYSGIGSAGAITLTCGAGGSGDTYDSGSAGGSFTVTTGAGGSGGTTNTGGVSGSVTIATATGGPGGTTSGNAANAGNISLLAGAGGAQAYYVGTGNSGIGGEIVLTAGIGGASTGNANAGAGGAIAITSGGGGAPGANTGGFAGGNAGAITITGGTGGAAISGVSGCYAGLGGNITVSGGLGGAGGGFVNYGGDGGTLTLTGGTGGSGETNAGPGNGGNLTITGGTGGANVGGYSGADGGNVTIDGGAPTSPGGTAGTISIGSNYCSSLELQSSGQVYIGSVNAVEVSIGNTACSTIITGTFDQGSGPFQLQASGAGNVYAFGNRLLLDSDTAVDIGTVFSPAVNIGQAGVTTTTINGYIHSTTYTFTGDSVVRFTVTNSAVTSTTKVSLTVARPTVTDKTDKGFFYMANVCNITTGSFDVVCICTDEVFADSVKLKPSETITLYYTLG